MAQQAQEIIENIFLGFFLTGICILGIIANLITLAVLVHHQRKNGKSSINYFLIGLSICDTLFLFTWSTVGLLYSHRLFGGVMPSQQFSTASGAYFSLMIRCLGYIGQAGGSMFIVAITLDRFLSVCHSVLAKRIWTQDRALILTIIIFVVAIIFAVPMWFALQVREEADGFVVNKNEFGRSTGFTAYNLWLYTTVNTIIPLPILIVLNALIFKKVQEARKQQIILSKSQVSEISLARMLLCVVLVFVICSIPAIIRSIIFADSTNKELIRLTDAGRVEKYFPYTILRILNWLGIAVNSGVNFLIYCVMSRSFRQSLIYFAKSGVSKFQRSVLRKEVPETPGPGKALFYSKSGDTALESTSNENGVRTVI